MIVPIFSGRDRAELSMVVGLLLSGGFHPTEDSAGGIFNVRVPDSEAVAAKKLLAERGVSRR